MKDPNAVGLGRKRWRGRTQAEIVDHMTMMSRKAAAAKARKKKLRRPPKTLDA